MTSGPTTSAPIPSTPSLLSAPTQNLRRIGLLPFVAVLFAYCTGGPFGFESMISTSGPGLALIFLLVVPWLFSVLRCPRRTCATVAYVGCRLFFMESEHP